MVWILLHERLLSIVSLRADEAGGAAALAVCCFVVRTAMGGVRPIDAVESVYGLIAQLTVRLSLVSWHS